MLPKNLLAVQKRRGKIKPKYLLDSQIVKELIQTFETFKGKKYKELHERLRALEGANFKLVRGLSTLLERRCEFQSGSKLNGRTVRIFLFERGFIISEEERDKLLGNAATTFNVSKQEIEEAIFSDLQDEQILTKFNPPSPEELIKQYNLSLTQTLLFDAIELNCKASGNYQQIFRQIKYLGLMYEINDTIKITGPTSLLKNTKKYGTSFAKLVPVIISADKWEITAQITAKVGGEPRVFSFTLTSETIIPLPASLISVPHFDSAVEAQFYRDFKSLNSRWEIQREPELIKAGPYVFIPDFGFYTNGLSHFLEVVGFWTSDYLQKKISKLRAAHANITVAVNQTLNCTKEDFTGNVIFYKKKIPLGPIVKILRDLEEAQVEKELKTITTIPLSEDSISLTEKAKELNISPHTLRRVPMPGYQIIGEQLVSHALLEQIKKELEPYQQYQKVEAILQKYNLTMQALDYLGYKIIWKGLIPFKIVKKRRKSKI